MKSSASSFRISDELQVCLEQTSRYLNRGKNWVINPALESYLDRVGHDALAAEGNGVVLSYDRSAVIPGARVQVQVKERTDILLEVTSDARGRFKTAWLRPGEYWLGISKPGFNLH